MDRLTTKMVEAKYTKTPRYGITRDGYSIKSGAPTDILVRLEGEKRWRRVMCWQWSYTSICFIKSKGKNLVISNFEIPLPKRV